MASTSDPNEGLSHRDSALELGRSLQALKRNDEAIQAYQLAHSLKPACTDTLLTLGTLLQETRRFQEAAVAFERIVSVDPNRCDGWLGLGVALLAPSGTVSPCRL